MQHTSAAQHAPTVVGVIDPDPVARSGLRTLLHGVGVDVCTFESAENYLVNANGRHLACLIVDLLLPGLDGATLITSLRSQPAFAGSKLIVITSLEGQDLQPYAFALEGVPVVHKPLLVQQLPPLLDAALAGR